MKFINFCLQSTQFFPLSNQEITNNIFLEYSTSKLQHKKSEKIKSISRRYAFGLPDIVYPEILVFVDDIFFQ